MNNDKKDDIVRSFKPVSNQSTTYMNICTWQSSGSFDTASYTSISLSEPWGMCVGDVNNDGFNDVQWGEGASMRLMFWNGSGYTGSNVTTAVGAGSIFVQGCNFFDINNDANLDMFICNDVGMSHIYMGNGANGWVYNNSVEMPLATAPVASDNSGNYASVWSDINNDGYVDLFITHCRQGVTNANDPRRIDQVFINNGNGTYTQDTTNWTGLLDGAQGWSTAFGDIDNDGDMDAMVLNYGVNSTLMMNDGSGVFTNQIASSGIPNTTNYFGENVTFHDFDNDGFLDMLVSGDEHYIMQGNGNGTFNSVANPFVYGTNDIRAHAVGDLNGDGLLDVYASYCGLYNSPSSTRRDRLWMNTTPDSGNHYIFFDLEGGGIAGYSNKNGVGAIVKIYGAWGVQVRVVHSGEGYGIQNSFAVHFGLGQNTSIDSVIVEWPSGIVDQMMVLPGDAHYTIVEGAFPTSTGNINNHAFHMAMGPNPMSEEATIQLFNVEQYGLSNLSMEIVDITGKVVYANANLTSNIVVVNKAMLASGMYMVQVSNGDQRLDSQKLMVR